MYRKLAISCAIAALVVPAAARTRPHYGGTLRVETAGDPLARPDGVARRLVYDGLTEAGPDGSLRAALAVSWSPENAGHRWQFRLRPGVQFHDGSPLTSVAVASSLMASCAGNCPWGSVRAVGGSVVFTSESPMPELPALLAADEFLIMEVSAAGSDGGTGPYQVASNSNNLLTLAANESSWQGRPFADTIEIRGRRSPADQSLDLSAGRADVVEVPSENIRAAQQQHLPLAVSAPVDVIALQLSNAGALANPNLRAAIACAVDRNVLASVIFQHQGIASAALLPQIISGFAFLFPPDRDLNKAHELRGGLTPPALTLAAPAGATFQLAAQRIALNLREAGLNIQLMPPGSDRADIALRTFRLTTADAAADLDAMARAAGESAPPVGSSAEAVYRAERELLDRRTLVPLVHLPIAWARSARVRDLRLRFDGSPDLASASLEAEP